MYVVAEKFVVGETFVVQVHWVLLPSHHLALPPLKTHCLEEAASDFQGGPVVSVELVLKSPWMEMNLCHYFLPVGRTLYYFFLLRQCDRTWYYSFPPLYDAVGQPGRVILVEVGNSDLRRAYKIGHQVYVVETRSNYKIDLHFQELNSLCNFYHKVVPGQFVHLQLSPFGWEPREEVDMRH